jgi:hypothetical protein
MVCETLSNLSYMKHRGIILLFKSFKRMFCFHFFFHLKFVSCSKWKLSFRESFQNQRKKKLTKLSLPTKKHYSAAWWTIHKECENCRINYISFGWSGRPMCTRQTLKGWRLNTCHLIFYTFTRICNLLGPNLLKWLAHKVLANLVRPKLD